ncbi:hypothetical protein RF11_10499 [Thelohanellus kitauei]|uniref:ISXO2-like transposase domain-containing protein n=1 Tax=Thelohanellus kitauei TaxID=669202 RepID=A0A0C2MIS7_THEKT|nr:hypothetical protein RF11_10499 [Thelohanellus kitauei]
MCCGRNRRVQNWKKNTHHRGHQVSSIWILGGIEGKHEQRVFLADMPELQTLLSIITTHVLSESKTIIDCFRSHYQLKQFSPFPVSLTATHAKSIEDTWNTRKMITAPRDRTNSVNEVSKSLENNLDLFGQLIWRLTHSQNLRHWL